MKRPNYVFDDELYHHGIPGQRWGHRRFQNEDGSWTAAGRERYGEGDGERVKMEKAKASYNTQKYKADLRSKAQQEKDARAAKEERNRIKLAAKNEALARKERTKIEKLERKEQAKIDKKQAKLDAQVKSKDPASLKNKLVRTRRYMMSDDELSQAVDRLKLEVEYNKQYALAARPNGALARADRFFEGATGKMVRDIAVATIPTVANTAASKILDSRLKYANELDRERAKAEIDSFNAKAKFQRAQARSEDAKANETKAKADAQRATAEQTRSSTENERNESQANVEIARNESRARIENEANESRARIQNDRSAAASSRLREREEINNARAERRRADERQAHDIDMDRRSRIGYRDQNNNWVQGSLGIRSSRHAADLLERGSSTRQREADAELGRAITRARYNDAAFLTSRGQGDAARTLMNITSRIRVNDWSSSQQTRMRERYDSVATNETVSRPVDQALALPSVSSNTESKIRSMLAAGATYEQIQKKLKVSSETISKIAK